MSPSALRRLSLFAALIGMAAAPAGCARTGAEPPEAPAAAAQTARTAEAAEAGRAEPGRPDALAGRPAGFDRGQSDELASAAAVAEAGGNVEEARRLYEQAALLWPDRVEAWRKLAELAQDPERREAAAFLAERVALYPSHRLYTQREVAHVIGLYVEEQAALPEANETKLAYLTRLAAFYRFLYDWRGDYDPVTPVWEF